MRIKMRDRYNYDREFRNFINELAVDALILIAGLAAFGIPVLLIEHLLEAWN